MPVYQSQRRRRAPASPRRPVSVEDKNWEASRDLLVQLMEEQEKPPSPVMQGKRRRLLHKLAGLNQSTSTLGTATPVHQAKSKKRGKP